MPDKPKLDQSGRRLRIYLWVLGVVLAFAGAIFLVQALHKVSRPGGNDLTLYLEASSLVWQGANPYTAPLSIPYLYPLFFAFVLVPLRLLPVWAVAVLWYGLSIASLALICTRTYVWAGRDRANGRDHEADRILVLLVLLLFGGVLQNNLLNGQINLFLMVLSMLFLSQLQSGRSMRASLLLAPAVATKLFPVLVLLIPLYRRNLAAIVATLVISVALCAAPLIVYGPSIVEVYRSYLDTFLASAAGGRTHVQGLQVSLYGALAHSSLTIASQPWLKYVVAAALIAPLLVQFRIVPDLVAAPHVVLLQVFLITPLVSPVSETHHLVFALPMSVYLGLRSAEWGRQRIWLGLPAALLVLGHFMGGDVLWMLCLMSLYVLQFVWIRRFGVRPGAGLDARVRG